MTKMFEYKYEKLLNMFCLVPALAQYLEESDRKADVCKRAMIVRTRHLPPQSTCHGGEDNRLRCCAATATWLHVPPCVIAAMEPAGLPGIYASPSAPPP